ncbi:toxin-antitoxin system HicB family antitoxin [Aeromonas veronii]|uniref:toxin-antitoxin system HicB family antitoxin n=1 Tax=Aeromonas veronii TaxID=654 RepID=UPI001881E7A0|nr:toxin-antitoxin system HicB family antitoxin [Aeromonas veronii]MBE8733890.1 toxin-antitoxin system HicB family antitoxin [Aeromonas veronii]MBE8738281.1 toxin-antitoxin system HicB family antitoxin [Aeromonas veronii]MBE8741876.1 toxin-antitoxin system HicB family antitoxin [Aeromonas veronii]MBE8763226.1 toxin-antitoxin system HicB family antitoxin [Aeromonas veronii]MBE8837838.1 toxin-antitoxin system HicB family antitoxin [Aeromonas veronii]
MINPEEYTVSVRMESVDGKRLYVARIQELPDVEEYADTPEFARELALDSVATIYEICQEKGLSFPLPNIAQVPEASGRVTLRLAKSIHAAAIHRAQLEGISLNQYMSNAISNALTKEDSLDIAKAALTEIFDEFNHAYDQVGMVREVSSEALNYFTRWQSGGEEAETCIEITSSVPSLGVGAIRYASMFNAYDYDEISSDSISHAFKIRPHTETLNISKKRQGRFLKVGA